MYFKIVILFTTHPVELKVKKKCDYIVEYFGKRESSVFSVNYCNFKFSHITHPFGICICVCMCKNRCLFSIQYLQYLRCIFQNLLFYFLNHSDFLNKC